MTDPNARQIAEWNGNSGERWVANQGRLDLMLSAFGDAALRAAAALPGEVVLDVGCGAGTSTLALARAVAPTGRVVGLDVSAPLVERAGQRAREQGVAAEFRLGDASRVEVPVRSFDLLFSRFGVMFFDDPVRAFEHLRAALKPNGRLAFVCWRTARENDWVSLPVGAVRDLVDVPKTDPEAPGPFAFGDGARVARILTDAGFRDVAVAPFDHRLVFGRGATRDAAIDDAVEHSFQVGPLQRLLADQPDDVRTRATAAVRAAFARRAEPDGVVIDSAAWIVTARAAA